MKTIKSKWVQWFVEDNNIVLYDTIPEHYAAGHVLSNATITIDDTGVLTLVGNKLLWGFTIFPKPLKDVKGDVCDADVLEKETLLSKTLGRIFKRFKKKEKYVDGFYRLKETRLFKATIRCYSLIQ